MTNWIPFLTEIANCSDPIATRYFRNDSLDVELKDNQTPVSAGDLAIETEIRRLTAEKHPELTIVGEEYGETTGDPNIKLIIDPIDGTKNFILGIPYFATLLAIEEHGVITAGFVSAPALNNRWWAQKGAGSFFNGEKITVSQIDKVENALALHGSIFGSEASDKPAQVLELLSKTYRQRGFGDFYPAMLVAMGLGEFAIDFKLKEWDIAALKIIVEEAGGHLTDTSGNDTVYSGNFIASNNQFHDTLVEHLQGLA